MERKGLYMDFLFSSKEKFKEDLIERVNNIKNIIEKVEEKYGKDNKVIIKDSAMIELKETLILTLSYLAMSNSNKVEEYKDKIIQKLAYIRENRILTLDQYKDTYWLLKQILSDNL
jgi:hypothetical protein